MGDFALIQGGAIEAVDWLCEHNIRLFLREVAMQVVLIPNISLISNLYSYKKPANFGCHNYCISIESILNYALDYISKASEARYTYLTHMYFTVNSNFCDYWPWICSRGINMLLNLAAWLVICVKLWRCELIYL